MPALQSTSTRLAEFKSAITVTLGLPPNQYRIVRSSGGVAADGVVSEGMGYGLLLAGVALSQNEAGSAEHSAALTFGEELYTGWRRMCELSQKHACQDDPTMRCGGRRRTDGIAAKGYAPCLPSWKFDNDIESQRGTGSATDGDEDALLGLILMLHSTSTASWPLWERTLSWTYESVRAFLRFNTVGTDVRRLPKLGSCWGGFDCNNPSYIAPAHYRAFRHFTLKFGPAFGVSNATLSAEARQWDTLIATSYQMLDDAQCDSTGLTPNWWRPAGPVQARGHAGCNASGTPADQFGSEAARGVWRVALDALWQPSAESSRYVGRIARHLAMQYDDANGFGALQIDRRCESVKSVHPDWIANPFMYAPLSAALLPLAGSGSASAMPPHLAERRRHALEAIKKRLAREKIDSYYSGSWIALATATLNGGFAAACEKGILDKCGGAKVKGR